MTPKGDLVMAPPRSIPDTHVHPSLRELFSQHPDMMQSGYETLSRALHVLRYLAHRPKPFEVEAAREVLLVEGELLP
jgi:hypothetical protein